MIQREMYGELGNCTAIRNSKIGCIHAYMIVSKVDKTVYFHFWLHPIPILNNRR